MGITNAYLEHTEDINISNIVKRIAEKYNVSRYASIQSAMDKTVGHLYPKTLKDTQLQKFFSLFPFIYCTILITADQWTIRTTTSITIASQLIFIRIYHSICSIRSS